MRSPAVLHFMVASAVSAALRFLAFPLLAATMSSEEFGKVSLFLATLPFLAFLTSLSLTVPWIVDWHGQTDEENRRRMGATLVVTGAAGLALSLVLIPATPWLDSRFHFGLGSMGYQWMLLAAVAGSVSQVYLELDKILQQSFRYLGASLVQVGLQLGASLGWTLGHQASFSAFLEAWAWSGAAIALVQILWRGSRPGPLLPRVRHLTTLLHRGLPTSLSTAFALISSLADRQFVHTAAGFTQVAFYTMGAKIGEIIQQIVVVPFLAAVTPALLAIVHRDPDTFPAHFAATWKRFLAVVILATTSLGATVDLLYHILLPQAYGAAIPITLFFLLGFTFMGIGQLWSTAVLAHGRLQLLMRLTLVSAVASLACNALLTPRFQGVGAACAAVLVQVLACLQSWWIARRTVGVPPLPTSLRWLLVASLVLPTLQLGVSLGISDRPTSILLRITVWASALALLGRLGLLQAGLAPIRRHLPF